MIFTSRTYRVAIRRSIQLERIHRYRRSRTSNPRLRIWYSNLLAAQINHTRKLQARKRKERK